MALTLGSMAAGNFGDFDKAGNGQGAWLSGGGKGFGVSGNYSPEQIKALQRYAATGQGGNELLAGFGGNEDAFNTAKNWIGAGGGGYTDPNDIANSYRANSAQGKSMQDRGWVDANGNPTAAGMRGINPLTGQPRTDAEMGGQAATAGASTQPGAGAALPATSSGAGLSGLPSASFGTFGGDAPANQFLPNGTGSLSSMAGGNKFMGGDIANPTQTDTGGSILPQGSTGNIGGGFAPLGSGAGFTEAPGNYTGGMKMGDYLNPAAGWARDEGLRKLTSSYAGAGNFLSGNALRGISDYTTNSALNQEYQPAFNNYMADKGFNYGVDSADRTFGYNAANNDRNFNYGVDTGNRAFDYAAQTGDRAFNADTAKTLGNYGLAGAAGQANSNSQLAALLAALSQSAGQAAGTGTIGQNNAITSSISSILNNMNQNSFLDKLLAAQAGQKG